MIRIRLAVAATVLLMPSLTVAQERAGAPLDVKAFDYERAIAPGDSALVTVTLDAAVLAHSSRSDLRIATDDGRQIPYLLDRMDAPLVVALPELERISGGSVAERMGGTSAGARSRYRIRLPFAGLPEGALVLRTTERVFDRRVSVAMAEPPVASDQPRRPGGEQVIASAEWRSVNPDSAAPELRLSLPPLTAPEVVLIVDEGDNPPLPIAAPRLELPAYRLRFFRPAHRALTLLYGEPALDAPRYDLALLAARLDSMPVRQATLGPERQVPHVARNTPLVVFWSALVIAVTLLLVLLVRLLHQDGSSADASPAPRAGPPPSTD